MNYIIQQLSDRAIGLVQGSSPGLNLLPQGKFYLPRG